jgi:hypothetical protein
MSWDVIDNVKPKYASAMKVPDNGVAVSARTLGARGGRKVKWIAITLGAETARKLSLLQPEVRVRLLLGGGNDAGKIAISVDATSGPFLAKRQKSGCYLIGINAASAAGLFGMTFERFTRAPLEVVRPVNGQPPMTAFPVDPAMLDADDD